MERRYAECLYAECRGAKNIYKNGSLAKYLKKVSSYALIWSIESKSILI